MGRAAAARCCLARLGRRLPGKPGFGSRRLLKQAARGTPEATSAAEAHGGIGIGNARGKKERDG